MGWSSDGKEGGSDGKESSKDGGQDGGFILEDEFELLDINNEDVFVF